MKIAATLWATRAYRVTAISVSVTIRQTSGIQGESEKSNPFNFFLIFQQCVQIFAWEFTQLLDNKI